MRVTGIGSGGEDVILIRMGVDSDVGVYLPAEEGEADPTGRSKHGTSCGSATQRKSTKMQSHRWRMHGNTDKERQEKE